MHACLRNTMAYRYRALARVLDRQLGFRKLKDGTYECHTYEPGYGNNAVQHALKPVYEPYGRGVARDMMKRNPNLRNYRMGKTKEVERNGKKMKRIRLQQAGGGY